VYRISSCNFRFRRRRACDREAALRCYNSCHDKQAKSLVQLSRQNIKTAVQPGIDQSAVYRLDGRLPDCASFVGAAVNWFQSSYYFAVHFVGHLSVRREPCMPGEAATALASDGRGK
jgi:hypothetical protein